VAALQSGDPVVGLGTEPGVREGPGEDHGTIDPPLLEVAKQFVLAGQSRLPRVTGGEPGVGGGDRAGSRRTRSGMTWTWASTTAGGTGVALTTGGRS